jgi:TRAP-type C4-dicarboxylate transport system permease small subunit
MEDKLSRILDAITGTGLIGLAVVVLYNAMVRFLPLAPNQMAWTEDIGRLLLLWVCFIGASVATRENKHFVIDVFVKKLDFPLRSYFEIFCDISIIIFLIILVWETQFMVVDQMDQVMPSAIEIPLGIYSLSLLIGVFIMIYYMVEKFLKHFRDIIKK